MSRVVSIALLGLAALVPLLAQAEPKGDPIRGKALFAICAACHDATARINRIVPTLKGVTKRQAGTAAGYAYSPALKAKKSHWSKAREVFDRFESLGDSRLA